MVELTPASCSDFVSRGDVLLLLTVPDCRLPQDLEALGAELRSVKLGSLDLQRYPEAARSNLVVGCPTCDLYLSGRPRARLLGNTSQEGILEWLIRAGLPVRCPPPAPPEAMLDRALHRVEVADALPEGDALAQLEALLQDPTSAYNRLVGGRAGLLPRLAAPALFACVREVPLQTRWFARKVRSMLTPLRVRTGLAAALEWMASRRDDRGCVGLLLDWLVLQAAWVEQQPPVEGTLRKQGAVGAAVAAALPADALATAVRVSGTLAQLGRVVEETADGTVEALLADLERAPPAIWEPRVRSVLPCDERPAARIAASWCRAPVAVEPGELGGLRIRLTDGTQVTVTGYVISAR